MSQELAVLVEEYSGEEGLLAEATNDRGKVTKAALKRLKQEVNQEVQLLEEVELLNLVQNVLQLMDEEAAAKKAVKAAQEALDKQVLARYPQLSQAEIKTLVVADKWGAALQAAVAAEIERVTQQLANRVQLLAERYAEPLPQIVDEVAALSSKVDAHLQRMGLTW